jgi:hypothetical protein
MSKAVKVALLSSLCAAGLMAANAAPALAQTVTYDFSGQLIDGDAYSEAVSAAPEASAWAMMIAGVALVGARLRDGSVRRRRPALAT